MAIKQVTRVFEKASFAKRALREITLLRHFANHENITGLIDVDAISKDFNEVYVLRLIIYAVMLNPPSYLFLEVRLYGRHWVVVLELNIMAVDHSRSQWKVCSLHPMNVGHAHTNQLSADLHQIVKSGQALTNEHVQYFLYQILRGKIRRRFFWPILK